MVCKNRSGVTLIELIFVLFLSTVLFVSVYSFSAFVTQSSETEKERLLMIAIRNDISSTSTDAMLSGCEEKMLIRNRECLYGYEFQSDLVLRFNRYGQLQKGSSVRLLKGGERFLLSVEPVTAKVYLKKTS